MSIAEAQAYCEKYIAWKSTDDMLVTALDDDKALDSRCANLERRAMKTRETLESAAMDLLIEFMLERAKEALP